MRALVLREWGGPLEPSVVPVPEPARGEVLVRVEACGVGDTLNNMRSGRNATMPGAAVPRILGHEIAGSVVAVGDGVEHVEVGRRVWVYMYLTCGRCEACRFGHDPMCRDLRGMVGLSIDGGFAEYVVVPADNVEPLPDEVSSVDACATVDAIATPWHALRAVAPVGPTDALVVVGAGGGVGIHAVAVGRLLGARVIGVDVSEDKLGFVREHGAHDVVDGRVDDVAGAVVRATGGRGANVILDYVASSTTLGWGFRALAHEGTLVVQGVNPLGDEFRVEPRAFVHRQLGVRGSRYASRREVAEAIELVRRGAIRPVVPTTVALDDVETVFELLARRALLGRAAVVA
ncbi:MAG TPA: alcohol dehydrogenase catalytic domain-containing protein [Actinomycetota bacterium]|nr:alcohol dehydrogenase catalytic domain-containing protein [Actinomycetota bacterium]